MRVGCLIAADGHVKRTWALISDTAIVPVEDGDQIIEWECDHGEHTLDLVEKAALTRAAVKEQDRIVSLKTQGDVLAHGETRQHTMTTQKVSIATRGTEPIYYGYGKGLHHRRVNYDGDVVETPSDPRHRLERVERRPTH